MTPRPLHALAEHDWWWYKGHNVLRFFTALFWVLTGFCSWGVTVWRNTPGAKNFAAGVTGIVLFAVVSIILSLVMGWKYEEKPERERQDREYRIAALERELEGLNNRGT